MNLPANKQHSCNSNPHHVMPSLVVHVRVCYFQQRVGKDTPMRKAWEMPAEHPEMDRGQFDKHTGTEALL